MIEIFIQLAFELGQAYQCLYDRLGLENVIDFNDIYFANSLGAEWRFKGNMEDLAKLFEIHKFNQDGIDELNKMANDLERIKIMAKEKLEVI